VVLHLACLEPGARVPIADIARHRLLPLEFVRRIVGELVRGGILATIRGSGGGVRLARPASEISLGEVVQVLEGDVILNPCVADRSGCAVAAGCPMQPVWTDATQVLNEHLASVRFDALARRSGELPPAPLRVPQAGRLRACLNREEAG
jgi:Rrf2 family protein